MLLLLSSFKEHLPRITGDKLLTTLIILYTRPWHEIGKVP
jgi:hypothetical protein